MKLHGACLVLSMMIAYGIGWLLSLSNSGMIASDGELYLIEQDGDAWAVAVRSARGVREILAHRMPDDDPLVAIMQMDERTSAPSEIVEFTMSVEQEVSITVHRSTGWPVVSTFLVWEVRGPEATLATKWGICLRCEDSENMLAVPLGPLLPGLFYNVLLYYAVIVSAVYGTRLLRDRARRLANLCPECRYSLGNLDTPGCPECGWGRSADASADG